MKNKKYILGALATIGIASAIILVAKKMQKHKRLKVISNAGYETAHDINYPLKTNRLKKI